MQSGCEIHFSSSFSRTSQHFFHIKDAHKYSSAFNLILLIYAIVQIFEIRSALPKATTTASDSAVFNIPINALVIIIPFIVALAELAYVILGWSIWREFGWKVYKLLGADRRIKRLYVHYQILACFMKFDVFFWCGFSIQVRNVTWAEILS